MSTSDVQNNNNSSIDDEDDDWQRVTSKRKHTGSPTSVKQHAKRFNADDVPSTSTNRFVSLANNMEPDNDDDDDNATTQPEEPKPPPIFIPDVADIAKMVASISKIISSNNFSFKSLRDGQVRLITKNVDSYRKIIKFLESSKKAFHTYQLKNERAYKVVIKGLHHSTSTSDIKAMLLSLGHQVRSVRNIISRQTKLPLPMFFVDLDPSPNNHEIYNLKSFDNAIIQIEPPKHFDDIVQCFRCQEFGHTKSYCKKSFRCVKCGLGHSTTECTKTHEVPPRCVNCLQTHTANYKGCLVYQNMLRKKTNAVKKKGSSQPNFDARSHQYDFRNQNNLPNMSYSEVTRGVEPSPNNLLQKIEAMLNKQIELTNTLINMMSMIMNKLCN